jgi:hypothetical protein
MEKITIKLDDSLFKKMQERIENKGCETMSQCARELIDLGLRIEEAAASQGDKEGEIIHPLLLEMLKNIMIWSLDTRLLVRFLVEKKSDYDVNEMADFMKKAKERAIIFVDEFLQNLKNPTEDAA